MTTPAAPAAEPATTDPAPAPAPSVPTPSPPAVAPAAPAAPAPAEDPAATITRLEADLKAARAEAGKSRVNAKQTAADEARAELAQTIGKALGLVPDGEPVDPAKLTEQLTATQAETRAARVELAVFKAAEAAGGDPSALLDSRTFLAKLAEVDPADTAAVAAVIASAVAESPRLGRPVVPGLRPNPAQGGSANPPLGLEAQIAAAEQQGDLRTTMRLKAQKLMAAPS